MGGYRNTLIRLFTFLGGIYFFLEFLLPKTFLGVEFGKYNDQITTGFIAIGAVAFALGLINILMLHGSKIVFMRKGALHSLALLLGLGAMLTLTLLDWRRNEAINQRAGALRNLALFAERIKSDHEGNAPGVKSFAERSQILIASLERELANCSSDLRLSQDESAHALFATTAAEFTSSIQQLGLLVPKLADAVTNDQSALPELLSQVSQSAGGAAGLRQRLLSLRYGRSDLKHAYSLLYDGLFIPLGSAMFSLLAFYIVAAGYRAFRVRSAESGLMMAAALVVMLGQIPFGVWLWSELPTIRLWLLEVPSSAAFRAIKFGASIALLIMAFRMWLSIESKSFVAEERGGKA